MEGEEVSVEEEEVTVEEEEGIVEEGVSDGFSNILSMIPFVCWVCV